MKKTIQTIQSVLCVFCVCVCEKLQFIMKRLNYNDKSVCVLCILSIKCSSKRQYFVVGQSTAKNAGIRSEKKNIVLKPIGCVCVSSVYDCKSMQERHLSKEAKYFRKLISKIYHLRTHFSRELSFSKDQRDNYEISQVANESILKADLC